MDSENINTLAVIIALVSGSIATYVGLRLRALKSEVKSDIEEKFVTNSDFNEEKTSNESKIKDLDERLRESEKDISIVDDRVKAIFKQMDKQGEQMTKQFEKIEANIKDSFKDFIEQTDKQNQIFRDMIKELYQTKQDKK